MWLYCNDWVWIVDDGGSYVIYDYYKFGCLVFIGRGWNGCLEYFIGFVILEKIWIFLFNYRVYNWF